MVVLSRFQMLPLLSARSEGQVGCVVSLDLGVTMTEVALDEHGIKLPTEETVSWNVIEDIAASENGCFQLEAGEPTKIQSFSELTNQLFSLMPTSGAPTMLVSGIPMHRIKGTDPYRDTMEKIKSIRPITGRVLDTATGLGYTAIEAAKTADTVVTIEIAPSALCIARQNPWSRQLFDKPKISQCVGDSYDMVRSFRAGSFSRVIHDPPVFGLAGDLYSLDFYAQLYRITRQGGRLFHYVGDPDSRSGRTTTRGVVRRLKQAGFPNVRRCPKAFGVVAHK